MEDNKTLKENEKQAIKENEFIKALEKLNKDGFDSLDDKQKELIVERRKLDNQNMKNAFKNVEAYEISSRSHSFTYNKEEKEGLHQSMTIETEDGSKYNIDEFIEKELWKDYNKNITITVDVHRDGRVWKEPEYKELAEFTVEGQSVDFIPELCSIRKVVQILPKELEKLEE